MLNLQSKAFLNVYNYSITEQNVFQKPLKRSNKGRKPDIFGTLVIVFCYTTWISTIGAALFGIYVKLDPFYFVIKEFAPLQVDYKFVTIIRLILTLANTFEAGRIFWLGAIFFMVYLRVLNNLILSLLITHNRWKQQEVIEAWKKIRILNEIANIFFNPSFCIALAVSFVIIVIANVATIKLNGLIPMPLFIVFAYLAVVAPFIITRIISQTSMLYEQSSTLLEELKRTSRTRWDLKNQKYEKRFLKSLRPLSIDVDFNGFRLYISKRSMKLDYYCSVISYTITAFLSIPVD